MEQATTHLILVHGGGVGPWMWRPQVQALRDRVTVHTPTLPGHDPHSTREFTSTVVAADSIACQVDLDALEGRVVVVGFSLGGQVALELAARRPERVDALVVQSSLLAPLAAGAAYGRVAGAFMPLARNRAFARAQAKQLFIPDDQFEKYFELSRAMTGTTLRNLSVANFTYSVPETVTSRDRPTLVVHGTREPRALQRQMTEWASRLPQGRLVAVEGAGHGVSLQRPEVFNAVLERFLAETR